MATEPMHVDGDSIAKAIDAAVAASGGGNLVWTADSPPSDVAFTAVSKTTIVSNDLAPGTWLISCSAVAECPGNADVTLATDTGFKLTADFTTGTVSAFGPQEADAVAANYDSVHTIAHGGFAFVALIAETAHFELNIQGSVTGSYSAFSEGFSNALPATGYTAVRINTGTT